MASYNIYIEILAKEKEAFFAKLQGIEFFRVFKNYYNILRLILNQRFKYI